MAYATKRGLQSVYLGLVEKQKRQAAAMRVTDAMVKDLQSAIEEDDKQLDLLNKKAAEEMSPPPTHPFPADDDGSPPRRSRKAQ